MGFVKEVGDRSALHLHWKLEGPVGAVNKVRQAGRDEFGVVVEVSVHRE